MTRRPEMVEPEFGGLGDGLSAELATFGGGGDVAEALRAGFHGGLRGRWIELPDEVLRGQDEEEVDDRSDEEEVDDGGDEGAVLDLASVDVSDEVVEVWLADD